jgi:hypothetical protein
VLSTALGGGPEGRDEAGVVAGIRGLGVKEKLAARAQQGGEVERRVLVRSRGRSEGT